MAGAPHGAGAGTGISGRRAAQGRVPGQRYKYRIWKRDGSFLDHCDPYGFWMEKRPHTASVLCGPEQDYIFSDQAGWPPAPPARTGPCTSTRFTPALGKSRGPGPRIGTIGDQLGELLLPYVQELGCNYIEFLPLSEHPSDASWGYQNTGFFSPTSRYGSPRQLKALWTAATRRAWGCCWILCPSTLPWTTTPCGSTTARPCTSIPTAMWASASGGSCNFMHSRGEVRSFLQSAAQYWLEEFHFDGLRMDAVSRLIYWQGDPARGENQTLR